MHDSLSQRLHDRLAARDAAGLRRTRRVVVRRQGQQVWLQGRGQPLLNFASNDTLGLSQSGVLREAMQEGLSRWGSGSGASHLVSGHTEAHEAFEAALAEWLSPQVPGAAALEFSTGYLANLGVLSGLAGPTAGLGMRVYADRLNHASLVEGALLGGGAGSTRPRRYAHNDAEALAEMLAEDQAREPHQRPLIVTDGVFSMDGDVAPLADLLSLAEQYDGLLLVDEAHAAGAVGPAGRGSAALAGLCSDRLVLVVTLGKAFGLAGASVICSQALRDFLLQTARPYIYTTASPPALAAGLLAALRLIQGPEGERLRQQLAAHVARMQASVVEGLGGLMPSQTSIQPLLVGAAEECVARSQRLEAAGYWVPAIRPPTVPEGTARLRVSLSAGHAEAEVEGLIQLLREISEC